MQWGSEVEVETKRRIQIAVYAYAYELDQCSLVSDSDFDALALSIRPSLPTGRPKLDSFFLNTFDPSTGMWIHKHPELDRISLLYRRYYSQEKEQ